MSKRKITVSTNTRRFKTILTEIEWDTGDIEGDGYDPEVIRALPNMVSVIGWANDAEEAKEWAMNDISDDYGFLIQACKTEVKEIG